MGLLLSADPDERAILSYLSGSVVLVYRDNDIFVSIAVVNETLTSTSNEQKQLVRFRFATHFNQLFLSA